MIMRWTWDRVCSSISYYLWFQFQVCGVDSTKTKQSYNDQFIFCLPGWPAWCLRCEPEIQFRTCKKILCFWFKFKLFMKENTCTEIRMGQYTSRNNLRRGIVGLDCSIRIAIQFGGLDCDWQSKVKVGFCIWIVNPVLSYQSKSKISELFYQEIKIS